MKLAIAAALALGAVVVSPSAAGAREWQVKMLNKGSSGKLMVFEPAFLAIKPGDSVKFIAADKGHNAESVAGMLPAGAKPFKGKINEEIAVRFTNQGVYGYKCLPHVGMGMVGVIQVGGAANKAPAAAGAARVQGMGKKVLAELLAKAR